MRILLAVIAGLICAGCTFASLGILAYEHNPALAGKHPAAAAQSYGIFAIVFFVIFMLALLVKGRR